MNDPLNDLEQNEELEGLRRTYEHVRAAHRRSLHPPPGDVAPSGIDWMRLEAAVLRAGPLARLEQFIRHFPAGAVAASTAIPTLIVVLIVIFKGTLRFTSLTAVALALLGTFMILAVCGLWLFVAFEAAKRRAAVGVFAVLALAVAVGPFVLARQRAQTDFADGAIALAGDRYADALRSFKAASHNGGDDPRLLIAIADALHQKSLRLDADVREQHDAQAAFAAAALGYYKRAGNLAANDAAVGVHVAELQFIRGDVPAAEQVVSRIAASRDAPRLERIRAAQVHAVILEREAGELQGRNASPDAVKTLQAKIASAAENAASLDRQSKSADSAFALSSLLLTQASISPFPEKAALSARALTAAGDVVARGGRSIGPMF